MALTKRQKQLDELKWAKSEELGRDACGTFDYCEKCNKALENPCDKAYQKLHRKPRTAKKAPAPAESAAPKAPAAEAAKPVEPKTAEAPKAASKAAEPKAAPKATAKAAPKRGKKK